MCVCVSGQRAPLPSRDHSTKTRRRGPILPQYIQNTQPSPVLLIVGWGKTGMGSLQDNVLDLHSPHLDQPICLIMNEWIQSVSKQPCSPRCPVHRQCTPLRRLQNQKRLNCKQGETQRPKKREKERGLGRTSNVGSELQCGMKHLLLYSSANYNEDSWPLTAHA